MPVRRLSAAQWLLLAGVALIAFQLLVWGESVWDVLFPFPGLSLCVASAALVALRRPVVAVWVLLALAVVPVVAIALMVTLWQPSTDSADSVESLATFLIGLGLVVQSLMLAAVFGLAYFLARWRGRQREKGTAVSPPSG